MLTTASRRPASRPNPVLPLLLAAATLLLLTPERISTTWRAAALSWLAPIMPKVARPETLSPVAASISGKDNSTAAAPVNKDSGEVLELRALNERLREALKRAAPNQTGAELEGVEAQVIARRSLWQEPLLGLGRGTADGVRLDAGVLHKGAVAGRIVATAAHASSMALLTHHDLTLGARLSESRLEGVLHGQPAGESERLCRLTIVARQAPGKVGEQVVTSGLDGVFPPGIWIGTVVKIQRSENFEWDVSVRPAVDESGLESVRVLTGRPAETPWPVKP